MTSSSISPNPERWDGKVMTSMPAFQSTLPLQAWSILLVGYPDTNATKSILEGIQFGVRIGFEGTLPSLPSKNHPSSSLPATTILNNIVSECQAGRIAGPFRLPPFPAFRSSPLGAVLKKHSLTVKVRRIHDLSFPKRHGVNAFIADGSVTYSRFDDAIDIIRDLGPGCFLWKTDLADAFRHIAVNPADVPLLGFTWAGLYFFDLVLPYGLRSSPRLFEMFATALQWIAQHRFGISLLLHYLDDFLGAAASEDTAARQFNTFLSVCRRLGFSLNMAKVFSPRTCICYLGLEIDTVAMIIRVPSDKLATLKALLVEFTSLRRCPVKRLQSLIGSLSFACKAVRPGRAFIRRMIDTLKEAKQRNHSWVALGSEFHSDLAWWRLFIDRWNGSQLMVTPASTSIHVATDASDLGAGGFFANRWFSVSWTDEQRSQPIAWRELHAVLLAAATWADAWAGKHVTFHVDNSVSFSVIRNLHSGSEPLCALARSLHFIAAAFQFEFSAVLVAGVRNPIADALSRLQLDRFRVLCPTSPSSPDQPQLCRIIRC
jgi:hypothetical protein